MSYWKLFYHVVTATKNRLPLLSAQNESFIFQIMENKIRELGGTLYAINGVEDHVHFLVSIPPKIAIADFIGQVKGVAATIHNKTFPNGDPFFWQHQYGVFSFDEKRLASVIAYVDQQKIHHAAGSLIQALERIEE